MTALDDPGILSNDLRRFFDSMAAHFPGHVMQRVLEPDGRIRYTYASPGLATLGLDPAAIMADPSSRQDWVHPDDAARWRAALIASAETLDTLDEEVRVIGADGRVRWVRSIGNPRRVASGAVVWDGIALDVTDKREALDALRLAKAEADAAEAAKARVIAGVEAALGAALDDLRTAAAQRRAGAIEAVAARLATTLATLRERPGELAPDDREGAAQAGLTRRQRDVLALVGEGKSNREIAEALGIAEGTAKLHVSAVLKRLGARNRTEALRRAAG
jgi:DNA-binding NarL/FixJ family response regulator